MYLVLCIIPVITRVKYTCKKKGENMMKGQTMLNAGEMLDPYRIGLAATMGYSELPVFSKITFTIISTGDELVKPGKK